MTGQLRKTELTSKAAVINHAPLGKEKIGKELAAKELASHKWKNR
jgi:hypothetical protein